MKNATEKIKFQDVKPGMIITVLGTRFRIDTIAGRGYIKTYFATQLNNEEGFKASAPVDHYVDVIPDLYDPPIKGTGGRWENPITGYMGATWTGD